jgi:hypothetical protein
MKSSNWPGLICLVNTILDPSGDQSACSSRSPELVSCLGPEPSAFMIQIASAPPPRLLVKRICLASGDQFGEKSLKTAFGLSGV